MAAPALYFVRIDGAVRGPLRAEQLREMATIEVVTPKTEIADHADGPWAPLATRALCAEVMPVKPTFGFKATAFEDLNRGQGSPVEVRDLTEAASRAPASFRGREIVVAPLGKSGTRDGEPLNDVQEMVLEVGRRVAANAPPIVLPPAPTPFPRWRWFLAAAVVGSAGFLSIPWFYERSYADPMTFSIVLGWVVLYDGLLVYLMVVDRKLNATVRAATANEPEGERR